MVCFLFSFSFLSDALGEMEREVQVGEWEGLSEEEELDKKSRRNGPLSARKAQNIQPRTMARPSVTIELRLSRPCSEGRQGGGRGLGGLHVKGRLGRAAEKGKLLFQHNTEATVIPD